VTKSAALETLIDDYQQLIEAIGDAIVVADPDGVIRLWNHAAERLFGFTEAEAVGNSLDLIIPERLRERHWAGYRKTMASGETRYGRDVLRVPAVHKDGRTLSIAVTVGLLYGSQREVRGIIAVIRDETTRFAEERNLRKRLAELERTVAPDSKTVVGRDTGGTDVTGPDLQLAAVRSESVGCCHRQGRSRSETD
jgi:PAS domain S-box-containing protein